MKVKVSAYLLCFFFSLFLSPVLRGEIIQLRNGNTLKAKVLKENEEFVTVQTAGGKVKIPRPDIQAIERDPATDPRAARGE